MLEKNYFNNQQICQLLKNVSAAYIVKKANPFKIKAYQEAAAAINHCSSELKDLWDENKLTEVGGIGKTIASHLDELFRTGKVRHFQQVFKGLPKAMFVFRQIPGIGPKNAYRLCQELKISVSKNALKRLEKAAQKGKIRNISGFGEKSEKEILKNLKQWQKTKQKKKRFLLSVAIDKAKQLVNYMKQCPETEKISVLGSLRRRTATIGDLDIAVASSHPLKVIKWFKKYPRCLKVLASGKKKATILLNSNIHLDLMVEPLNTYGSLLQHFTGSKKHNINLRKFARFKNYSLSEYGIKKIKKEKPDGRLKKFSQEKDFYHFLGLSWIPPELREGNLEIEKAAKHNLPDLIKLKDIKGDLHLHSSFEIETSHDLGLDSFKNIALKAQELNYQYIAFSEHNPSYSQHSEKQIIDLLKRKKEIIEQLNYSLNKDNKKHRNKLFIFNSLEIDIKPNGKRAISDKALKLLDFAIVSVHSQLKLDKEKMTKRILEGLNHPKVKFLAHPTGRKINEREGYELNWEKIFSFCFLKNKFLEINSSPQRLDLPDFLIKLAISRGIKLVINTDSHQLSSLNNMKYGVYNARRGWATKNDIINTLSCDKIKKQMIDDYS